MEERPSTPSHASSEPGEEEEEEDIFDRFTDPTKKRKRKAKKLETEQERRQRNFNMGKKFADDHFNEEPSAEDAQLWRSFTVEPMPGIQYLKQELENMTTEKIGYIKLAHTNGIAAVVDFLAAAEYCTDWLDQQLRLAGWKRNMTGYVPITVSHSTNELLMSTAECYKMALKQMLRLQEHSQ
jgi:hypothetical protein